MSCWGQIEWDKVQKPNGEWECQKPNGKCPDCDAKTVDGIAYYQCCYSPEDCKTCGSRPCDGSC